MPTPWQVPFALLGLVPGAAAPARAALRIAPFDVALSLGGGFVISPETFEPGDDGELEPVSGGLYDEDTFGPLPRTPEGGVDLDAYHEGPFARRPQIRRAGEILLPATVLHPWLHRHALPRVSAAVGLDVDQVEGLLSGRLAVSHGGSAVVVVAEHAGAPAADYRVGADALAHLARRAGAPLEGLLHRVPVLPAGLRPPRLVEGELILDGSTPIYERLLQVVAAYAGEMDDDRSSLAFRARRAAVLSRHVDALFLDGLDAEGRPASRAPVHKPLASMLTGAFGGTCLADLAAVDGPEALVLALRGPLFIWRARAEASGLEIVPLDADGAVDDAMREKSLVDRAAGTLDQVYTEQLGPTLDDQVLHGPVGPPPHVDVFVFAPRKPGDPMVSLTAGASSAPMLAAVARRADPYIELVLLLPADLDEARRHGMTRALLDLARFPFRKKTFLAGGHDLGIGGPVVPGSALTAWVIYDLEEEWTVRLSDALPRHPRFLHAVAVTAEEQAFKCEHGSRALRERLGSLVSDPRRG